MDGEKGRRSIRRHMLKVPICRGVQPCERWKDGVIADVVVAASRKRICAEAPHAEGQTGKGAQVQNGY